MFDLFFFGIVDEILGWREGIPFKFMNEHESWNTRLSPNAGEKAAQRMLCMDLNEKAIRHYVRNTYFTYFGFQSCFDLGKYSKAWDTA